MSSFQRFREDDDNEEGTPQERQEDEDDVFLQNDEASAAVFNYAPRAKTDASFSLVFLTTTIACFVLGVAVVFNTNAKAFATRTSEDVLFSTTCAAYNDYNNNNNNNVLERRLLSSSSSHEEFDDTNDDLDDAFDGDDFWQQSHAWLLLAIFSAIFLGVTFLYGFQHHANKATWGIIGFKILSSFSFALYLFSEGSVVGGSIFLILTFILAYVFHLWREEIALVNRLLQTAATALSDQKHTLTATLGINMFVSVFVFIPFIFSCRTRGCTGRLPRIGSR